MKHAKFRNRVLSALLAFVLASGMAVPSLAFSIDAEPQGGGLTWEKIDNNTVEVENPFRDAPVADYETVLYDDTDTVRVSIVLKEKSTLEKGFTSTDIATANRSAMRYRQKLENSQETMAATISRRALDGSKLDVVWNMTLAANIISAQVILKPESVLGLATGSTPIGIYHQLIDWYKKGDVDFSRVVSINLDEYCGLSDSNPQSYRRFMREHFFDYINISPANIFLPDGTQTDSALECARYDRVIVEHGGIDLQLLGIGRNAHIGFNEPDVCFSRGTHQVTLTESTIAANTRFFERVEQVPRQAYSVGMQAIMQAKKILLIASGADKAEALQKSFFGPVTPQVPASILQLHQDVTVIADMDALALCPAE